MPICDSRCFGRLEWNAGAELSFPCGLPGFEDEKTFIAVQKPDLEPLVFLQSPRNPGVCFLTVPVHVVSPHYEPAISPDDLAILDAPAARDVLCLAIVSLNETGPASVNLLAPVAINVRTRVAVQAIRPDERYSCREPVAVEEEEPVCS